MGRGLLAAQHSDALVADGPFRYTRNPLYLANLPMAAGIGVLASRWGFVFLVLANWIFVYRLILREEEALRHSQGESYRAYCEKVLRFWPSFTSRLPPGIVGRNGARHWEVKVLSGYLGWLNC
jgi:protein-S-isoprenylcysteine O-methyltransferase Ste14